MAELIHRYTIPFGAKPETFTAPALDLARFIALTGHRDSTAEITLLDASDYRLLRVGILLAQRSIRGEKDWYMSAPMWAPFLPDGEEIDTDEERIPEKFQKMLNSFIRGAELVVVASICSERNEYALRNAAGETVVLLRDTPVTISRGGLTTSRYREVVARFSEDSTPEQQHHIDEIFRRIGGVKVEEFPSLPMRLGIPAMGYVDMRKEKKLLRDDEFETFVSGLLFNHVSSALPVDLGLRTNQESKGLRRMARRLHRLQRDLEGLRPLLEQEWLDALMSNLESVQERIAEGDPEVLDSQLYLDAFDSVVAAVRNPRMGTGARGPAGSVIRGELASTLTQLMELMDGLDPDSDDASWEAAFRLADRTSSLAGVTSKLYERKGARLQVVLERLVSDLAPCLGEGIDLPQLSAEDAFTAGRQYERSRSGLVAARHDILDSWPHISQHLAKSGFAG